MGATPTGATPTGPTLDPLNILVNKFNIATHVALILFLFSSWINYLLYDTKSVMVFWQLLSKIKRFVTIFRISWNGPTLFNIPIGDFPPKWKIIILTIEIQPTWQLFWTRFLAYIRPYACTLGKQNSTMHGSSSGIESNPTWFCFTRPAPGCNKDLLFIDPWL